MYHILSKKVKTFLQKEGVFKNSNTENYYKSIFLILFFIFVLSFVISYLLTNDYIIRSNAVSLEEVFNFSKALNIEDLNNLYKDNLVDTSLKKENSTPRKSYPIIIIGYHQVRPIKTSDSKNGKIFITTPETFEKEIKYLYDNDYKTITTSEYIKYLNDLKDDNFLIKHKSSIPEKSVVITFDDGYLSQYEIAFPILKKYNMKAEFYIYKDCIDKYPVCMNSNNLKYLANNGMRLGNHTLHHVFLTKYKDDTIKKEITENQIWLTNNFGTSSVENILAYPYGVSDLRVKNIVKGLGYYAAIGINGGQEKDNNNLFNLHRYLLGDDYTIFEKIFTK